MLFKLRRTTATPATTKREELKIRVLNLHSLLKTYKVIKVPVLVIVSTLLKRLINRAKTVIALLFLRIAQDLKILIVI